jgi:hypothetical protein
VLHLDGESVSQIAATTYTPNASASSSYEANAPRIVCTLLAVSHAPRFPHQPASIYLSIPVPVGHATRSQAAGGSAPSARSTSQDATAEAWAWLRADAISVNSAARAVWRAGEQVDDVMNALSRLARSDPKFLEVLTEVALSVAAPHGITSQHAKAYSVFTPSNTRTVPGRCLVGA